jgi:hypothetical protein
MSTTLGSNAASATLSDIPGTHTDLVLVTEGRANTTLGFQGLGIYFNGTDSTTNYSGTLLYGTGSTAASERYSNVAILGVGLLGPSNGDRGQGIAHIMSYANTNVFKTVVSARSYAPGQVSRFVGLWRSTSAITSITLREYNNSHQLLSGMTISLYGIKAA